MSETTDTTSADNKNAQYTNQDYYDWIIVWYATHKAPPRNEDFASHGPQPVPKSYEDRFDATFTTVRDEVLDAYVSDYTPPSQ